MNKDKIFIEMYLGNLSSEDLHVLAYLVNYMICKKELYKKNVSNKNKISKAIEYINQHWVIDDPVGFKNDLLQILEDKEVKK